MDGFTDDFFFSQESPLSAKYFMVAADQEVMMDNLKSFTDALVGMFLYLWYALPSGTWGHTGVSSKVNVHE